MFVKEASCAGTNADKANITQAENLPVEGSWESGTLVIGPADDGKRTIVVKCNPATGGVAYGGGRYPSGGEAEITVSANPGWFFVGWSKEGEADLFKVDEDFAFTVGDEGATFIAIFIEDKLYQAEQAKAAFAKAQEENRLTWEILVNALDAYGAVLAFLEQVGKVDGLLTEEELNGLYDRYYRLTEYYAAVEELNLSDQNIEDGDLAKLSIFTGVVSLDLSGNKGVTRLSGLAQMKDLATLDISGTGVTTTDVLVTDGALAFPDLGTLVAGNLSLASVSALADLVTEDGFDGIGVVKWDFTGSTLADTEENKADVEAIKEKLGEGFLPPTLETTPPSPGGSAALHDVTVEGAEHGKVAVSPANASKGDAVTIAVTPDQGFEVRSVSVTGVDGEVVAVEKTDEGSYVFEMPACDATVNVVFGCDGGTLCVSRKFSDVDCARWYHDAIDWAVENGVLHGIGGTDLMAPDGILTRAQMATVLWNLAGNEVVAYNASFVDVAEDDWFSGAVAWAVAEGLFYGYENAVSFGPDDELTREQAAAVLMRWSGLRGEDVSGRADLSSFPDACSVSPWAAESMSWAVAEGVLSGVEVDGGVRELQPSGSATRAQAAALMMNLSEG